MAEASLEIASDLGQLTALWEFIRGFGRRLAAEQPNSRGLAQEDRLFHLELAANEAASNIIRHAYGGRGDRQIQVIAEAYDDRIRLQLFHEGASFDPKAVRPPSFDGSREGGFGVFIIQHSVDEVSYTHDEGGRNCISLTLRAQADSEEQAA